MGVGGAGWAGTLARAIHLDRRQPGGEACWPASNSGHDTKRPGGRSPGCRGSAPSPPPPPPATAPQPLPALPVHGGLALTWAACADAGQQPLFVTPYKQQMSFGEFVTLFRDSRSASPPVVPYLQVRAGPCSSHATCPGWSMLSSAQVRAHCEYVSLQGVPRSAPYFCPRYK